MGRANARQMSAVVAQMADRTLSSNAATWILQHARIAGMMQFLHDFIDKVKDRNEEWSGFGTIGFEIACGSIKNTNTLPSRFEHDGLESSQRAVLLCKLFSYTNDEGCLEPARSFANNLSDPIMCAEVWICIATTTNLEDDFTSARNVIDHVDNRYTRMKLYVKLMEGDQRPGSETEKISTCFSHLEPNCYHFNRLDEVADIRASIACITKAEREIRCLQLGNLRTMYPTIQFDDDEMGDACRYYHIKALLATASPAAIDSARMELHSIEDPDNFWYELAAVEIAKTKIAICDYDEVNGYISKSPIREQVELHSSIGRQQQCEERFEQASKLLDMMTDPKEQARLSTVIVNDLNHIIIEFLTGPCRVYFPHR